MSGHKISRCALIVIFTGLVGYCLWQSFFCVVTIRGNSMYPSLCDGDKVLVLKTDKVGRGDIVLVNIPSKISVVNPDRLSVKRLIALPGDVVYAEDGRWFNRTSGKTYADSIMSTAVASLSLAELSEKYKVFTSVFPFDNSHESIKSFCERVIPSAGMSVEMSPFYVRVADYEGSIAKSGQYSVVRDYCFVIGDNAFDSRDSRYYGPVPFDEVKGKVICRLQNNSDKELEVVLNKAGGNRIELEKVLAYCRADETKYRSALYLIKNMPGHYSYVLSAEDKHVKDKMSSMYREGKLSGENLGRAVLSDRRKVQDLDVISANFLIDNIDAAVEAYRTRPWNRTLPFADFCELILPYRVGTEPLQNWRSKYRDAYSFVLDSLAHVSDPVDAVNAVYSALDGQLFMYYPSFSLPNLGPDFLLDNRIGGCREVCDFTLYLLRSLGLPVATDFYNQQNIHSWNVIRDVDGKYVQFLFDRYGGNEAVRGGGDGRTKGKVWRMNFSKPYVSDVTSDYFPMNSYTVKCLFGMPRRKVGLGMFVNAHWYPVCRSLSSYRSVTYRNIEPGTVYLSMDENDNAISYPFVPQFDGSIVYLVPDVKALRNVELRRKIRVTNHLRGRMKEMDGTSVWGYRDDNHVVDSLGTLYSTISNDEVLNVQCSAYDGLIIRSNSKGSICLADLRIVAGDGSYVEYFGADELRDDDYLTYYMKEGTVILPFKSRTLVERIIWTPRNDDNFIKVGDIYELFYQDGANGWVSLGVQTATANCLVYENIPSNALFWLHDHSRGREEEVFIINDAGEQVFI